jgi:hypothetical protein
MPTPDWVRVRLPESGAEVTISGAYFDGLPAGSVELLDSPALNSRGLPLSASRKNGRPQKSRTTVRKEAAKKAVKKAESPAASTPVGAADRLPEEAAE